MPEHTLPAAAMAHALGADFIEQDVVMTKDNALIVLHDITLDTTTDIAQKYPARARGDGRFYAADFTLSEIKTLNATERFNPQTGAPVFPGRFPKENAARFSVPELEEEFALIQGLNKSTGREAGVYVEIKEPAFHAKEGKDIVGAVLTALERCGYNKKGARAIVQTFDFNSLKEIRAKGWRGELAFLVDKEQPENVIASAAKYATIYAPSIALLSTAHYARKYNMALHLWTHRVDALPRGFKTSEELLNAVFKEARADGLFSDFPDVALRYLNQNSVK